MKKLSIKKIAYLSVFCALCFISTLLIIVPLPNGYVNAGDVLVLLCAWCFGAVGAIPAGIGCALADILSGYVIYSPVTLVVKSLVVIVSYYTYLIIKKGIKNDKLDFLPRIISAVLGEFLMVFGYFLFESILYGFAGGAMALVGNTLQGVFCGIGATLVVSILFNVKSIRKVFPKLISIQEENKNERY